MAGEAMLTEEAGEVAVETGKAVEVGSGGVVAAGNPDQTVCIPVSSERNNRMKKTISTSNKVKNPRQWTSKRRSTQLNGTLKTIYTVKTAPKYLLV
jgi:hypothetical protein